jgi:hypothetical protein
VPDDTGISPLGMHPKEPDHLYARHTGTSMVSTALGIKSKLGKKPQGLLLRNGGRKCATQERRAL